MFSFSSVRPGGAVVIREPRHAAPGPISPRTLRQELFPICRRAVKSDPTYQYKSTFSDTQDMALAANSIIEGEARMHETRYQASVLGLDPSQVDWMRRFDNSVAAD